LFMIIGAVILVWNIVVFLLYRADKERAKSGRWRISEATLIGAAFLMGGAGAMLGMSLLRHKTKHIKFKLLVPLAVAVNIAVIAGFVWFII